MMLEHKRRVDSSSDGLQDNKGSSLEEDLVDRVMHTLDDPSLPAQPVPASDVFFLTHTTRPPRNRRPIIRKTFSHSVSIITPNAMTLIQSILYYFPRLLTRRHKLLTHFLTPPSQVIQQYLISFDSIPIEPFKEIQQLPSSERIRRYK